MALSPEQKAIFEQEKRERAKRDIKGNPLAKRPNRFWNVVIAVTFVVIAITIYYSVVLQKQEMLAREQKEREEDYQAAIEEIKAGNWEDATYLLVNLQDKNYKDAKVLYAYAEASNCLEAGALTGGWDMAAIYCNDIPDNYNGILKEQILAFKKDCLSKVAMLEKARNEANKITPGSHIIRMGMTTYEAEISMGKPEDINRTVTAYGVHEQWCYPNGVYLYFDNGILTSWQD